MAEKWVRIALLAALAAILFTIESLIPMPIPWVRLGLANLFSLLALAWWGWKESMVILLLRVLLGALMTGRLFSPVFILSLSGGLVSVLVMAFSIHCRYFSLIGVSLLGALGKNLAQLFLASWVFAGGGIWILLPFFLATAGVSGLFIGFLAEALVRRFEDSSIFRN